MSHFPRKTRSAVVGKSVNVGFKVVPTAIIANAVSLTDAHTGFWGGAGVWGELFVNSKGRVNNAANIDHAVRITLVIVPHSGALRRGAHRDFHTHPIPSTNSF